MIPRLLSLIGLPAWGGYLIAGIVALLIGSNAYTFLKTNAAAEARCQAASLRAALETAQADLAITQQSAQRDRDAVERLAAADAEQRRQLDEYARTVAAAPGCLIDDAWMRHFGPADRQPNPAPGGRIVPADPGPPAPPSR